MSLCQSVLRPAFLRHSISPCAVGSPFWTLRLCPLATIRPCPRNKPKIYNNSSTLRNLFPIHQNILSVVFSIRVIQKNRVENNRNILDFFLLFFPNARNIEQERVGIISNIPALDFLVWKIEKGGNSKFFQLFFQVIYLP